MFVYNLQRRDKGQIKSKYSQCWVWSYEKAYVNSPSSLYERDVQTGRSAKWNQ